LYREQAVAFEQLTPLGDLTVRWIGQDDTDIQVTDEFDIEREVDSYEMGDPEEMSDSS